MLGESAKLRELALKVMFGGALRKANTCGKMNGIIRRLCVKWDSR